MTKKFIIGKYEEYLKNNLDVLHKDEIEYFDRFEKKKKSGVTYMEYMEFKELFEHIQE